MPTYEIKKEIENNAPSQEVNKFNETLGTGEDNIGHDYLLGRELAHEADSSAYKSLKNSIDLDTMSPEELAQKESVKEPGIDPVSAFVGGFSGPAYIGIKQGLKLIPSLGRALLSGVVSLGTEYPIGAATEKIEEISPALAVPFSVATGMLSGATIENKIEKSVIKALSKKGKVSQDAITQGVEKVKANLIEGKSPDEITANVIEDINRSLPPEQLDELGVKRPVTVSLTPEGEARLDDIRGRLNKPIAELRETRGKAKAFLDMPTDISKARALNINLNRINSEDDIKEVIQKTADLFPEELNLARRATRSNEMTKRAASMLGMTPEQLLRRRRGQPFKAEEAVAARRILVSSAEKLKGLADRAIRGNDFDQFEFRKALNVHYAIQAQVSGMTAEAGRALQSFRIPAKATESALKQIDEMLSNLPQGMTTKDLARYVSSIDTIEGITKFSRQAQRATTKDMFLEAWINGLLSGPQTHAVNTLSNSLVALWQIPERFMASGISKITGSKAIQAQEALYQSYGLIKGFRDGMKSFAKVAVGGEPSDIFSKLEVAQNKAITAENIRQLPLIKKLSPNALEEGGVAARAVDILGSVVRTPGRMLVAEDEFFKSIGYRMELNARAFRTAMEEGLEGNAAAKRIQEILSDPEVNAPEIHAAAIDAARYQTFTKPLGKAGQAYQRIVDNIPVLRLVTPFIRTPTNILKFAGERTPLALASKAVRAEISAGGARRDLALAKMSLGSMVMGVVATMAAEGHITGGGPVDPKMRQFKYNTGWQPYSIKIGDKYFGYNRLEPMGMLFGLAADFSEITGHLKETEREDLATAIVSSITKNVTNKTWLRGLSETIRVFDDPGRYGDRYLQNFVGTFVPTGAAQLERIQDPVMRDVNGYMDAVRARVPGFSKDLPARRNIWGEKIILEGGLGPDIISPIYTSTVKESPIDKEIIRLDKPFDMPRNVQYLEGVPIKLTPHQYEKFLVFMNDTKLLSTGQTLKKSLDNMVQNDGLYKQTSDDNKIMMIREKILEAKELAKQKLINEESELKSMIQYGQRQLLGRQ